MINVYTAKEAAAVLKISYATLKREIADGRLPHRWVRGRLRFTDHDLERYLARNTSKPRDLTKSGREA